MYDEHLGIDLEAASGTSVFAFAGGTVTVGQQVVAGQSIGKSGASGYGSDYYYDAHLHHEIRHSVGGVKIPYDPAAFYATYNTYVNDVYGDKRRPSLHSNCSYW